MNKFKVGDRVIRINMEDSPIYIVSHILDPAFDGTCHCYVIKHSDGSYYTSVLAELCLDFAPKDSIPRHEIETYIDELKKTIHQSHIPSEIRLYAELVYVDLQKILDKYKGN